MRGKMTRSKDGTKVDQHGRFWKTGKTGHGKGRARGKRGIGGLDWEKGIAGGKYTEPQRKL